MHSHNIFLLSLHILSVLSLASARITQYIICSDDQEFPIKAAVAEARSLARTANIALRDLDVVYSESYQQWFGSGKLIFLHFFALFKMTIDSKL